ncbi:Uma2 family endonuclease [Desertifilum sp. FACHB-1129]|uniref:Uma2 family endonuclease n=1 Tax=unclassified Desertifilum TaxID=2621682 RepID=UPI00168956DE|nr:MULTISPECIES: Uma2 family endonuclease [unclassified Desertifilum]MBD2311293.1 Uma2 family endonuclease [Desertifilum sp. FACHB-1129]MBD2321539.1 Uma2 family endonuclease [Desertifilum sp. FACHB-866]MBD2331666.1 Uma2 family endonuclease [Desertifilum sp. FACHB-868]MDA0213684.1 Uma2 family endonuclease [Cyanobacteria bacterium FC1]
MVSQATSLSTSEIVYPDSDGQPMSDNTKQFRWIVVVQQNLEWLFADHSQVFIAGDLLWYPVQGNPKVRQAPDVMVVFGRPKGDRGSYQQWNEGDIAPQVVFEILSPGNTLTEMNKKQVFYDRYGVEEYYLYDPERNDLSGWLRSQERLDVIDPIADWVSPRLGIRFDLSGEELALIRPDGERFATYVEIQRQLAQLQARVLEAESLLEQERLRTEQERLRAERLAQRLREAGIDPDAIET